MELIILLLLTIPGFTLGYLLGHAAGRQGGDDDEGTPLFV